MYMYMYCTIYTCTIIHVLYTCTCTILYIHCTLHDQFAELDYLNRNSL